jgi:hypothetical protein
MNRREALKRTAVITGIAISGSTAISLLQSCQGERNRSWKPVFFTKEESVLVSAICNVLIPKTETPGAIELHLPQFLDVMINDCLPDAEKVFRKPFNEFSESVINEFSKSFEKCNSEDQCKIVEDLEEKSESDETDKYVFYHIIKDLTQFGYLSSEYVMKNLLDYQPIPVDFKGCIDVNSDTTMSVSN